MAYAHEGVRRIAFAGLGIAIALVPISLQAQGDMSGMPGMKQAAHDTAPTTTRQDTMASMLPGPLGISHTRLGSGTSWLPDASPMRAYHWAAGSWNMMLHGDIDLMFDDQGSARGDRRVVSTNWLMLMAMHPVGAGLLHLHAMGSAEPLTVGGGGYPLLLQTGESWQGQPLKDHQHPHDLFMELAAMYEVPVSRTLAISLYAAPVGEPAMGPVAFMHRPAAQNSPLAPISHHWQDATHITFGVLTAGVYTSQVKLEASLFNGREPDENRYDFDFRTLDSYSARLIWNPSATWNASTSYGYLKSPESLTPDRSQQRISAAVQHSSLIGKDGELALSFSYGAIRNSDAGGFEHSLALESNVQLDDCNTVFGRAEYVQKTAEDLVVTSLPSAMVLPVYAVSAGYIREVATYGQTTLGLGIAGSINVVPQALQATYGTRTPVGMVVYLRLRPAVMAGHAHRMAPSMNMSAPGNR